MRTEMIAEDVEVLLYQGGEHPPHEWYYAIYARGELSYENVRACHSSGHAMDAAKRKWKRMEAAMTTGASCMPIIRPIANPS